MHLVREFVVNDCQYKICVQDDGKTYSLYRGPKEELVQHQINSHELAHVMADICVQEVQKTIEMYEEKIAAIDAILS